MISPGSVMRREESLAIGDRGGDPPPARVAFLLEPGRRGAAALEQATARCAGSDCELTVVAVAPTVATVCRSCGGVSACAYNGAVREDVSDALRSAVAGLSHVGQPINGRLLVDGSDPPFEQWVAQGRFDLVLLPARLGIPGSRRHPAARPLRRRTSAQIRVV